MTASTPVVLSSNSWCVRRWIGTSGWLGTVERSGSSHTRYSLMADGMLRWYSSEESEENPSSPISSSKYSAPSGARCWVWRFCGTWPTER